ncbi:uncharacterized protein B0H18DRAFT_272255 [Fomitopsis serialis]|uniref:uncharacterized protein n=1 Tax=Fomitopsis serialis TaxID=139415 RepID=UPI0020081DFF|nr:uncharacterized protein B0H18DRAFT_272255 [Neoantrodia serialis]KAH9927758.1 hypothetical protein B0H18DRAFT_272255 [Neoantrodia serialis]
MSATTGPNLWACRWNWCAQVFEHAPDLLDHLKTEHFTRILRVEKKDWDIYLRSNEGQSGMTDSLLQGIPTQSSEFTQPNAPTENESLQSERAQSTQDRRTPNQPPGVSQPENDSAIQSQPELAVDSGQESPSRGSPIPAEELYTPPLKRGRSFADCDAASSPITTPMASPLPPTPPLHSRVVDAINFAASQKFPSLPLPRRNPPHLHKSPTPLPLPRRTVRVPAPQSSQGSSAFSASHSANVSVDSSTSARDVETQLTGDVASPTPSPVRAGSPQKQPAVQPQSYPIEPYPPLQTQAPYVDQDSRADEDGAKRRFSSGNMIIPMESSSPLRPMSQTHTQPEPEPPATQAHFASQFNSGCLSLRLDSEPPDAMDVDEGLWPPLQLQTQAAYLSQ